MSSAPTSEVRWNTPARRAGRVRLFEVRSPWCLSVPESAGPTFHIVRVGACWLVPATPSPLLRLEAGDLVLLAGGAAHVVTDHPSTPRADVPSLHLPTDEHTTAQGTGKGSRLLSGGYRWRGGLPLPALLPEVVHLPADRCRRHGLRTIVDLLAAELEEGRPAAAAVVAALADALPPLVAGCWLTHRAAGSRPDAPQVPSDRAIAAALERIHAEPERDWTLTSLAREATLSRAAFARRFARAIGEPPGAYLARWRMTIASQLLRESDLKLAAIARRVGYTSEFAFAKAFKRDCGIAPGAYRRQVAAA
jgi:AraC-like DNA-binding protein